jgi:hypothetical protein
MPLAGKNVVFSVRGRKGADFSSASSLLTGQIKSSNSLTEQAIAAANGTYTTSDNTVGGSNFTLTTTATDFSFTVPIPSDAAQVAIRITYAPVGTAGANDWCEVEEMQLALGTVASAFVPVDPSYAMTRAREQFQKTYNPSSAPGAVTYNGALRATSVGTVTGEAVMMTVRLDPPMRTTPTVTLYSPQTGTSGKMAQAAAADIDATSVHVGISGFGIQNAAAATASKPYYVHAVAEAKL